MNEVLVMEDLRARLQADPGKSAGDKEASESWQARGGNDGFDRGRSPWSYSGCGMCKIATDGL